jgi:hypothetical protein
MLAMFTLIICEKVVRVNLNQRLITLIDLILIKLTLKFQLFL